MTCQPLSDTGLDATIALLAVIALTCVAVGALLVLLADRSRRTRVTVTAAMLLALGLGLALTPGSPVHAADADCRGDNSLSITQTSTMDRLAPDRAPESITGLVVNNGSDSTQIDVVEVSITSVTHAAGAAPGTCDASDYRILRPRMRVDRHLRPGGSTTFAGAAIGFATKITNQDACKNSVVHLRYTVGN